MAIGRGSKWVVSAGGLLGLFLVAGTDLAHGQESVAVRASLVKGTLPVDDPAAAAWATAAASEFPMSPQVHWPVRITEVTAKTVKVKALHDGTTVAFLLEFADPTEDPEDAAALEFMVGDTKAHFAHGQPMAQVQGGPVNIWYWKNKEREGRGYECDGLWDLESSCASRRQSQGSLSGRSLEGGVLPPVDDRACDGGHPIQARRIYQHRIRPCGMGKRLDSGQPKEKGSEKAISSWWYFRADAPPDYSPYMYARLAIALAVGFELVLVKRLKKGS